MAVRRITAAVLLLAIVGGMIASCGDPNASAKPTPATPNLPTSSKKNTKNLDIGIK